MKPAHLAERRALYAAIAQASDRHLRPRVVDPRLHQSARSTLGACEDRMWIRIHQGRAHWRIERLYGPPYEGCNAVTDDWGDLVTVPPFSGIQMDDYGFPIRRAS